MVRVSQSQSPDVWEASTQCLVLVLLVLFGLLSFFAFVLIIRSWSPILMKPCNGWMLRKSYQHQVSLSSGKTSCITAWLRETKNSIDHAWIFTIFMTYNGDLLVKVSLCLRYIFVYKQFLWSLMIYCYQVDRCIYMYSTWSSFVIFYPNITTINNIMSW